MLKQNDILEIVQVANGFIVRATPTSWFIQEGGNRNTTWAGERVDYMVFRTMAELLDWLQAHFTHRAKVLANDAPTPAKAEKKAA